MCWFTFRTVELPSKVLFCVLFVCMVSQMKVEVVWIKVHKPRMWSALIINKTCPCLGGWTYMQACGCPPCTCVCVCTCMHERLCVCGMEREVKWTEPRSASERALTASRRRKEQNRLRSPSENIQTRSTRHERRASQEMCSSESAYTDIKTCTAARMTGLL